LLRAYARKVVQRLNETGLVDMDRAAMPVSGGACLLRGLVLSHAALALADFGGEDMLLRRHGQKISAADYWPNHTQGSQCFRDRRASPMRLVLIGILLLLIGLWLAVLAHSKSGGKPARIRHYGRSGSITSRKGN
jgi:hypothetical protein